MEVFEKIVFEYLPKNRRHFFSFELPQNCPADFERGQST